MQSHYKHNGQNKVYSRYRLPTVQRLPPEPVCGHLPRCRGCPYPGHGFVCGNDERCMSTEVSRLMERDRRQK